MFAKPFFGQNWGKLCGYGDKGHDLWIFLHELSFPVITCPYFEAYFG